MTKSLRNATAICFEIGLRGVRKPKWEPTECMWEMRRWQFPGTRLCFTVLSVAMHEQSTITTWIKDR